MSKAEDLRPNTLTGKAWQLASRKLVSSGFRRNNFLRSFLCFGLVLFLPLGIMFGSLLELLSLEPLSPFSGAGVGAGFGVGIAMALMVGTALAIGPFNLLGFYSLGGSGLGLGLGLGLGSGLGLGLGLGPAPGPGSGSGSELG